MITASLPSSQKYDPVLNACNHYVTFSKRTSDSGLANLPVTERISPDKSSYMSDINDLFDDDFTPIIEPGLKVA